MPPGLFTKGNDVDELYKWVRDDPAAAEIKNELDSMWAKFEPFADKGFKKRIKTSFKPLLWEMYLATSLLNMGFKLLPRPTHAPDICIELDDRQCWIECVMPSIGDGPDRVPERKIGDAGIVPEREITLRFTNCITEKAKRFLEYEKKKIVGKNDILIIAVNGDLLGKRVWFYSLGLYIYKCLYGVGDLFVRFDRQTGETGEPQWNHRATFDKTSGKQVDTCLFGSPDLQHTSAVLYAPSITSFPYKYGHDLVVHHNPIAKNPTKVGFLRHGLDFYVDNATNNIQYDDRSGLVNENGDYFLIHKTEKS